MSTITKRERTLRRREIREKKFRQRYLLLCYSEKLSSGDAIRQLADDFNITEARAFVVVRPADVRVMLEKDWSGTMKAHGLDLPKPEPVKPLTDLEATDREFEIEN
jgi:hypothetical protein